MHRDTEMNRKWCVGIRRMFSTNCWSYFRSFLNSDQYRWTMTPTTESIWYRGQETIDKSSYPRFPSVSLSNIGHSTHKGMFHLLFGFAGILLFYPLQQCHTASVNTWCPSLCFAPSCPGPSVERCPCVFVVTASQSRSPWLKMRGNSWKLRGNS